MLPDMQWLEHDEVPADQLPAWAQDVSDDEVALRPEGLVFSHGRLRTAVPWASVLTLAELRGRLLVVVPRKPPRRPWLEVPDAARAEKVRVALEERAVMGSYRAQRPAHGPPLGEVVADVRRHRPVPGALEIPVQLASTAGSALVGGVLGLLGGYHLGVFDPRMLLATLPLGVATGALGLPLFLRSKARARGRILVLTPQGYVGALDSGAGVGGVPWQEVGAFRVGQMPSGAPCLDILRPDGTVRVQLYHRIFAVPLELVVAIAEAYRVRASR